MPDIDMIIEDDNIDMQLRDAPIEINLGTAYGTKDHNKLLNRDLEDQHPMDAITGLTAAISGLQDDIDKHPIYYHDGSMLQHYKG